VEEPRSGDELARVLMRKAGGDEIVLVRLIEDDDVPDEVLGFHAQQAVEKMIKAVLASNRVSYERTHNITYLLTLLDSSKIARPEQADSLPDLTPWAAGFRYSDLPEPALDRQETLSLVDRTKAWATGQLDGS
jgi:HEPN domain-containing protein